MPKFIIANWKMNLSYGASLDLIRGYAKSRRLGNSQAVVIVCPGYPVLPEAAKILKKSPVKLGAQDSAAALSGAHTGEVSPLVLREIGAEYVIIGHSERREQLHENSPIINAKLAAALEAGLTPMLCIGEKMEDKKEGATRTVLRTEIRRALKGIRLPKADRLIIAYEPIWAISSAKGAKPIDPAEAADLHRFIQAEAAKIIKKKVRVIYGGSVNPGNFAAFLKRPEIGGLLVGAASLKLADFEAMC